MQCNDDYVIVNVKKSKLFYIFFNQIILRTYNQVLLLRKHRHFDINEVETLRRLTKQQNQLVGVM